MFIYDRRTLVRSFICRSQWPRGLRRGAVASRLGLWVRIPPVAWLSVVECCVLSVIGLCVGLVTRPGELHRV